ncbi:protein-glutamate methylesterase/protein-glutamine glutaminase [Anaeroselena agilis]|uniref:Protein-glutamate methylesterase/protein-glutamine glutaminase n=1 Tax=Anaeroselena agilis TaxID=3063788 RepID=A0ABU3NWX9_9FIRM|nr:chemotaxis response regulator protein-glutamate methylesterase [Selenomonadales bacterium 4137-cl]
MIKVLVVDDSAFMRKVLSDLFAAESDFTVLEPARNGKDAIDKIKRLKPDVVTMDVEMPVMDGISALETIMREIPTPVVMVSSLTREGADATLRALECGAVDFVAKTAGPISSIDRIRTEILAKCRAAARANVRQLIRPPAPPKPVPPAPVMPPAFAPGHDEQIVAIGTSTGGPRALQEILTRLPGNLPCPVVIVQHMPPGFTKSLSDRLNSLSALSVKEAEDGDILKPGLAVIAPGDFHMTLVREGAKTVVRLHQEPPIGGHRPSVDPTMEAVARIYGPRAVGVILTGMGADGSRGLKAIKNGRGFTIAEDQSTTVVFGMPKAAIELGIVDKVVPLPGVAGEIVKHLQSKHGGV